MDIKEQDSQHLVIGNTSSERRVGIAVVGFVIIFLAVYLSVFFEKGTTTDVFMTAIPIIILYGGVRALMGKRIVLEKSTKSVILEAPNLLMVRQKRIIRFIEVNSVEITYKKVSDGYLGTSSDAWQVSLDTGGKMVKIDSKYDREHISLLANKISRFIGKELVDNSWPSG